MSQEIVKQVCSEFMMASKYHSALPNELENWYVYCCDSGHNILCCLKQYFKQCEDNTNNLTPVPIKYVQRTGYEIIDNYVVVEAPYSEDTGLMVPVEDNEF